MTPAQTIVNLVNEACVRRRKSEPRRDYLGASMWGEECERKLGYFWHKAEEEPREYFPLSQLERIADMGRDCEARMAGYLRAAGFNLLTEKADGGQFGFKAMDGKMAGHADGVFIDGPDEIKAMGMKFPMLWENKGLNNKGWNAVNKNGVEQAKPIYFSQVQIYSAYFDLQHGSLFTAINRDSGEILAEHVPLEIPHAQFTSDKALRVVQSEKPEHLSRITDDPSNFRCKLCPFKERCHSFKSGKAAGTMQLPFWVTQKK